MMYVARDVIGLKTKNIPVPTSTVGLDLSTFSLSPAMPLWPFSLCEQTSKERKDFEDS